MDFTSIVKLARLSALGATWQPVSVNAETMNATRARSVSLFMDLQRVKRDAGKKAGDKDRRGV